MMATRNRKNKQKGKCLYERQPVDTSEDPSTWNKTKLFQE